MAVDDATMKAIAAVITGGFALAVFSLGPRRASHVSLAAFLALISANQAAETARALATDPAARDQWGRLAAVFASLDPFALYYFASVEPVRNRLNGTLPLLLAGLPAAGLALASARQMPVSYSAEPGLGLAVLIAGYTAAIYALVLVRTLAPRRDDDRTRALAAAMAVAALPLFPRLAETLLVVYLGFRGIHSMPIVLRVTLLTTTTALVLTAITAVWLARRFELPRRVVRPALAWGLSTSVLLYVPSTILGIFPHLLDHPIILATGRAGASVRWLTFGALVSVAIVRGRWLETSLAGRRRVARLVLGLGFLAAGGILLQLVFPFLGPDARFAWPIFVGLAVVTALSQGFRELVDRTAHRLYGVPARADARERMMAYRIAARDAARAPSSDARARLDALREELELSVEIARAVESGVDADADGPLAIGERFGQRYRTLRVLAGGATSRVLLADDEVERRLVAVKEIPLDPTLGWEEAAKEARLAGALDHPHVVRVLDVVRRRDHCLIVSEHVAGGSLADHIAREGALPTAAGLKIAREVLEGLAHVHSRGLVHRDLKPGNVLLTVEGRAKIADFGLARVARDEATRVPGLVGTPAYMAPEQGRGDPATPATDVYAFGLLVRRTVRGPLPAALDALLARALREHPAERPADAVALLASWRAAQGLDQ